MTAATSTTIMWPWVALIIVGCALVSAAVVFLLGRRQAGSGSRGAGGASAGAGGSGPDGSAEPAGPVDEIWVANSDYLRSLPEFQKQLKTYRGLQVLGALSLTVALTGAALLAARPAIIKVSDPRMANRDIVLCLDVSASMLGYDRELVDVFSRLVDEFAGERIALSIFNTTSRAVFPLTDDYGMVKEQLDIAYDALHPNAVNGNSAALAKYEYFAAGANANLEVGASLIGDGLANCALMFEGSQHPALIDDDPSSGNAESSGSEGAGSESKDTEQAESDSADSGPEARSRSIIFATDNDLEGIPIYSLKEAADLATKLNVSLIGLYGSGSTDVAGEEEFQDVFTDAGGMYFYSDDPTMVDAIVTDIQSRQAVLHDAAPVITSTNTAGPWFILLVVGLAGFLYVQWRLSE